MLHRGPLPAGSQSSSRTSATTPPAHPHPQTLVPQLLILLRCTMGGGQGTDSVKEEGGSRGPGGRGIDIEVGSRPFTTSTYSLFGGWMRRGGGNEGLKLKVTPG